MNAEFCWGNVNLFEMFPEAWPKISRLTYRNFQYQNFSNKVFLCVRHFLGRYNTQTYSSQKRNPQYHNLTITPKPKFMNHFCINFIVILIYGFSSKFYLFHSDFGKNNVLTVFSVLIKNIVYVIILFLDNDFYFLLHMSYMHIIEFISEYVFE